MLKSIMKKNKNKKGFTLVELIVVLVILAILAAILVPALLGYIDKAREKQYTEEAHSIYTASQVVLDEKYAASEALTGATYTWAATSAEVKEVNSMVDPTAVSTITITPKDSTDHGKYTIGTMTIDFTSQNGTAVHMEMTATGTWNTTISPTT